LIVIADKENVRGFWMWWPLRLVALFVVLCSAYVGGQFSMHYLAKSSSLRFQAAFLLADAVVCAWLVCYLYRLLVRWMEGRKAEELAWNQQAGPLIFAGVCLGALLFCAVYALLFAFGVVSFHGFGSAERLAVAISASLVAAFAEEVIFRGVIYRLFEQGFGTAVALILSGAFFGLIHSGNPGATVESTIAIALEAGVLLAAAYALTRSLWLPIGLHFGWNFTEGGIFGAAVSGGAIKGLINAPLSGPDYLTGGSFGPEASIIAVGIALLASLVILILAAKRGQWRALRFQLRSAEARP
jgi:hypothetical protein